MIIKSICVQNFRCIRDETLPCEQLTVLVGPNGSGKSSFLRALQMFYTPVAEYSEDDFYDRDTTKPIIVAVTFTDLTDEEKKVFKKYVKAGDLTVEKEMWFPARRGNQKYYGSSLQNPEFDSFRSASGAELRKEYNKLRKMKKYSSLPPYTNKEAAEKALQEWEENNPDKCVRRRDKGQFFGFKEVGTARLERYTRFILIPAVRDAGRDAAEGRDTPLTEIMDLVVRSALAQREEVKNLQEYVQKQYDAIMDPSKLKELRDLESDLNSILKTYVPDSSVKLTWLKEGGIEIPMPKADIKLVEDGFPSAVGCTGHGLQRVFILTLLQYLAFVEASVKEEVRSEHDKDKFTSKFGTSNLIIGIEEPELYQHPNRQRNLSKVFLKLVKEGIKGVAERVQIIYSTHSPLFVDIERFDQVRLLRKESAEPNKPKQTKIYYTSLDEVARVIERADGKPEGTYTGETLRPRLRTLMTPWMNEGFFADVIVLVEGEEDRAAILGVANAMGYDFESMGISVIPCMGKTNLDRPTAIFRNLRLPVYVIWDSDYGGRDPRPEVNRRLLRLFSQPVEDWPEKVTEQFACFKKTLGDTLRAEIGNELFSRLLDVYCRRLSLKKKHAIKNPQIIQEIISEAYKHGKTSRTLEKIISQIVALKMRNIK